jgi:hypothetical protein
MSVQPVKIDDLPIGRFHLKIAGLTFGAHFTDGYILGLIGIAFTLLSPQMQLDAFWQGLIGASALIGLFLGSLFFGWISDKVGRQKIFLVSFVLITIASVMQFYAETAMGLILCRVLIGIGLGGDFSVGHAMLAEFAPKKHRGVLLGSFSVIWTFGYVAATFVGTAQPRGRCLALDAGLVGDSGGIDSDRPYRHARVAALAGESGADCRGASDRQEASGRQRRARRNTIHRNPLRLRGAVQS